MSGRGALLKDIQLGRKLNKTTTNDRSGSTVGGSSSSSGTPMGGVGLPRPPMVPPGAGASRPPASAPEPKAAAGPMPGFGSLFSMERPKLKHRTGGVDIGRANDDAPAAVPPPTPERPPSGQKASGGLRFGLPFRRNSHARNSSSEEAAPDTSAGPTNGRPAPPAPLAKAPPPPPVSAPSPRPAGPIGGKKAPPLPPSSTKPQIAKKPAGLGAGRVASPQSPPPPSSPPGIHTGLRQVPSAMADKAPLPSRASSDDRDGAGGIVAESQGSVSSLAGMFGQSVRGRVAGHGRPGVGPPKPADKPPAASWRSSNTMAPTQPPPPPPPPQPAAKDPQAVPVREGKWTFHPPAEFPAPPSGKIPPHAYPSGNYTGSALNVSI